MFQHEIIKVLIEVNSLKYLLCCSLMAANSSSSRTSISACSIVFPTRTSKIGITSRSKSNNCKRNKINQYAVCARVYIQQFFMEIIYKELLLQQHDNKYTSSQKHNIFLILQFVWNKFNYISRIYLCFNIHSSLSRNIYRCVRTIFE